MNWLIPHHTKDDLQRIQLKEPKFKPADLGLNLTVWKKNNMVLLLSKMSLAEKESNCWNCSSGHQRVRARFKLIWLRGRCDWLKMVLISSQGWCKACRARLNASNPVCFTENNPGTAASAPGSCAGAAFKETEGPEVLMFTPSVQRWSQTLSYVSALDVYP